MCFSSGATGGGEKPANSVLEKGLVLAPKLLNLYGGAAFQ